MKKMANEKRLIDADALDEAIRTDYWEHFTQCHDTDQTALIDMVCEDIGNAPTVDAVEVVRCKDCKHRVVGFGGDDFVCGNPYYGMASGVELRDDDFCSYGERRTDDKETG